MICRLFDPRPSRRSRRPHGSRLARCGTNLLATNLLAAAFVAAPAPPAAADEGMWLFNEFPTERVREAHGWAPDQAWLDRVREAAVRFNNGGSGSFVSPDGLVATNHHVGIDCIQKLSSAEHDYVTNGFTAATRADELPCPDLELNVLDTIERVTARVRAAVPQGAGDQAAAEARRAETARIEAECQEATGLRCNVISLYQGGEYDLYRYRRHTDVRLAWAPELALANFGGDPDNFEYPRFTLDAALFRVYEEGEPHSPAAYLPVDPTGPELGALTFLVGNPGSTGRLTTVAELRFLRDVAYPFAQAGLQHRRDVLLAFSARGEEEARIARDDLLGVENSLKAISGYLSGLLDDELMAEKAREEAELRRRVAADEALAARVGDPWADMARALDTYRGVYARAQALNARAGRLPGLARSIVRLAHELAKPNTERRRAYRDTALPSYYQRLYSDAPVYPAYDELLLTQALQRLAYQFGPTHPLVEEVLGDRTPEQVAREAIAGTKLADIAVRRRLAEGGAEAVAASDDPLVVLMRKIDPYDRQLDELVEDEVEALEADAGERIAEAYFAVHGQDTYPDATFTLRISYGTVKPYGDLPWHTTLGGLFQRAEKFGNEPPFQVPPQVAAARERLDLSTALDFVTTHDIIGGNSGSPVVDKEGRFVGVVFDGNLEMLPNRFVYSMERARAISVDVRAILEVLRKVYPAGHLADELTGPAVR